MASRFGNWALAVLAKVENWLLILFSLEDMKGISELCALTNVNGDAILETCDA
jgi:hypothetical protein